MFFIWTNWIFQKLSLLFAFIWIFLGIFPVWCYCSRMIKKATVITMEHWLFDINKKLFLSLYGLWHERRIVCNTGATPGQPVSPQVSLQKSLDSQKNSLDLKKITRIKILLQNSHVCLKWYLLYCLKSITSFASLLN